MTTVAHDSSVGGARAHRSPIPAGLGFAVVSAAAFALSGPLARGLMAAGWTAAAAVAARVLIAGIVLVPVAAVQLHGRYALLRRNLGLVAAYGLLAVAGCQLAYFNAVAHMQVGMALLIEYTSPVAVLAWLWMRHGQRPGLLTVAGGALGLAGLVLMLDLLSGAHADPVGIAWALGAMLGGAAYFVLSSRDDTGLPGAVLATGGLLVGGLALLPAGALGIVEMAATTAPVALAGLVLPWWVPVLVLGVVTASIAYITGIAATRRLGSRLASFVALLEVLLALVFAWALLGEVPRPIQAVGGLLVLVGVVVVKLGETRTTAQPGTVDVEPAPRFP